MLPRENDKPNAEEYPSLPFVNAMSNMAALHAPMASNVKIDMWIQGRQRSAIGIR